MRAASPRYCAQAGSARVPVRSMESHHIGMLLSSRKAVLSKCIDLENEVRGLFKVFGLKLAPKLSATAPSMRRCAASSRQDAALSHALLALLDARLVLYHTLSRTR